MFLKQDDQYEHTFSNYVRIRDVVQKTSLRRWTIGKSDERGSGISVLPARHDDDDDDILITQLILFIIHLLWHRKGSLMKTQTQILDKILYYTRRIELHRKGKKSRTVRITPILICGICCSPQLTGKCDTRPFLGGSGRKAGSYTCPAFLKMPTAPLEAPKGVKASGGRPPEAEGNLQVPTHSTRSMPQKTRPAEVLPGTWRGAERDWSAVFDDHPTQRACVTQGYFHGGSERRAVVHTLPAFPKMPTAPSAFPLLGAPQAPDNDNIYILRYPTTFEMRTSIFWDAQSVSEENDIIWSWNNLNNPRSNDFRF